MHRGIRLLLGVALVAVSASAKITSVRDHYVIAERNRHHVYEVTRIHDQAPASVVRTFLIADNGGPLLRIDIGTDYSLNTTWTKYQLQRGSLATATISERLPFTSTTPEGHRDEAMKHPELRDAPVPVTIDGSAGAKVKAVYADWSSATLGDARRNEVRRAAGKELSDALDSIRELAGLPMFADLNVAFTYFFNDAQIVRRSMKLMVAIQKPNCEFDAKFALPCAQ